MMKGKIVGWNDILAHPVRTLSPADYLEPGLDLEAMTVYKACSIVEGFADFDASPDDFVEAWSCLIRTGVCWQLQGRFGRQARTLIDAGRFDEEGNFLGEEEVN